MYGASVCLRAYVYVLPSFFCAGFLSRAVSTCMISLFVFFVALTRAVHEYVFSFVFLARSRALLYALFPLFLRARTLCVCVFPCFCARAVCVRAYVCVCVCVCVHVYGLVCTRVCVIFPFCFVPYE